MVRATVFLVAPSAASARIKRSGVTDGSSSSLLATLE
jgi:hypothetical protein